MPHKRNPITVRAHLRPRPRAARQRGRRRSRTSRCGTSATSPTPRSSASSCPTRRSLARLHARPLRAALIEGLRRATPSGCCENLEASHGLAFSGRVLLALVEAGLAREDAYELVQRNAMRAWDEERAAARPARRATPRSAGARRGRARRALRPRRLRSAPRATSPSDRAVAALRRRRCPCLTACSSHRARCARSTTWATSRLLMVASDRISAFDVVLPTPIPDKGRVLTGISAFWFERTRAHRRRTTCVGARPTTSRASSRDRARRPGDARAAARDAAGRVRRARLPGRLRAGRTTSATGAVCGHALPPGLRAGRAPAGADLHARDQGRAERARREHHRRRRRARSWAPTASTSWSGSRSRSTRARPSTPRRAGIILADTKFEFGLDAAGALVLATRC